MTLTQRRAGLLVAVAILIVAGSPALWDATLRGGRIASAATVLQTEGDVSGRYSFSDVIGLPGARCTSDLRTGPGSLEIAINGLVATAFTPNAQSIESRAVLYQIRANGTRQQVAESAPTVAQSVPASFPPATFSALPLGPDYVVVVEISWKTESGDRDGFVRLGVDHYRQLQATGGAPIVGSVLGRCPSPRLAAATIVTDRGTVNSTFRYDLRYFPLSATVNIQWDGRSLGTVPTGSSGTASGSFKIPAAPMGNHTIRWFTGHWSATKTFTVVPRIKLIPGATNRGQTVDVSLRGYAAREVVRIRWKRGASWVEVARVTTSSTGSANIDVVVPPWATDGASSVRGDGSFGRAQTNAFVVTGGPFTPAEAKIASTPTPTATSTAVPSATATATATATPTPAVTVEPSATPSPTETPEPTPTETPAIPTATETPEDASGDL